VLAVAAVERRCHAPASATIPARPPAASYTLTARRPILLSSARRRETRTLNAP